MAGQGRARKALLGAACLLGLAGCQHWDAPGKSLLPARVQRGLFSRHTQDDFLPSPNAAQKLNMQLTVARSLEAQGKLDEAMQAYAEVARRDRRGGEAHHRLAVLHEQQGNRSQADAYYKIALKRRPHDPVILGDYGYSLYLRGDWERAESVLRQAAAGDPDSQRIHNNLGLVLARTGRPDEALDQFAQAGCNYAQARSNLGYALLWNREWGAAQQQFQLALHANPKSQPAREGLVLLASQSSERPTFHGYQEYQAERASPAPRQAAAAAERGAASPPRNPKAEAAEIRVAAAESRKAAAESRSAAPSESLAAAGSPTRAAKLRVRTAAARESNEEAPLAPALVEASGTIAHCGFSTVE